MKIRIAMMSAALAVVGFSACGDDTSGLDGGTAYAISAGTFQVTNAVAKGTDECGLIESYQDPGKKIGITDTNGVFGFNLTQAINPSANLIPTAVLDGNTFGQTVAANYTVDYTANGGNCVVRIQKTVTGNLVADNTAALTYSYSVAADTGTTCTPANTNNTFAAIPCSSTYTFTATLVP